MLARNVVSFVLQGNSFFFGRQRLFILAARVFVGVFWGFVVNVALPDSTWVLRCLLRLNEIEVYFRSRGVLKLWQGHRLLEEEE